MTRVSIKNPFKNQGLAVFAALMASFGKRFGKKKLFKINEMPRMPRMTRQKWRGGEKHARKKKKESEKECKRNVNKPYRIVNQKVEKSANSKDKRQFTHGHTASHYYIYIYYILYYLIKSNIFSPAFLLFSRARMLLCATSC